MAVSKKTRHRITLLLFIAYLILLFYFLFFAEAMGRMGGDAEYRYNLIPLHEIKRFIVYRNVLGYQAMFLNIFGNVLAFLPFGYFIAKLAKKRENAFSVTLYSFEFSLFVEIMQLFTKLGSFDVDDIILNTLGGLIGYIVYFTIEKIRSRNHDNK